MVQLLLQLPTWCQNSGCCFFFKFHTCIGCLEWYHNFPFSENLSYVHKASFLMFRLLILQKKFYMAILVLNFCFLGDQLNCIFVWFFVFFLNAFSSKVFIFSVSNLYWFVVLYAASLSLSSFLIFLIFSFNFPWNWLWDMWVVPNPLPAFLTISIRPFSNSFSSGIDAAALVDLNWYVSLKLEYQGFK